MKVDFVYDMISIVCTLLCVLCVSVFDVVVLPVGLTTRCLRPEALDQALTSHPSPLEPVTRFGTIGNLLSG